MRASAPAADNDTADAAAGVDAIAALQRAVRSHLPALDGLRGLAVISVVWHNSALTGPGFGHGLGPELLGLFSNMGWLGVQLFFVLSGFLITGILLDGKGAPQQLRNFYMRRMLRIFPIYYAVLIVAFIVLPALGRSPSWSVANRSSEIWYWTYLVNWIIPIEGGGGGLSHFWSLAVEEQFYLLWPFAVIALQRRALVRLCLGLIVSAPILRALLIHYDFEFAKWAAYEFTFARWDALGMGALLALIVRDRAWLQRTLARTPLLLGSVLAYVAIYTVLNHNFAPVEQGIAALNQSVAAVLFALLLLFGILPMRPAALRWQRVLDRPFLRHVGKYSYGIYVLHFPIVVGCVPFWEGVFARFQQVHPALDNVARVLAVAVSSYLLARCSWVVVERPFLNLKRFFVTPPLL